MPTPHGFPLCCAVGVGEQARRRPSCRQHGLEGILPDRRHGRRGMRPEPRSLPVPLRRRAPALAPSGRHRLDQQRPAPRGVYVGFEQLERIVPGIVAAVLRDRQQVCDWPARFVGQTPLRFRLEPRRQVRPSERPGSVVRLARRRSPPREDDAGV